MGNYLDIAKQTRAGGLTDQAAELAGMPQVRITVRESEDIDQDVAFMQRLASVISEYPGANRVICTIVTLHGCRFPVEWRALACRQLRQRLSDLVKERSLSLDSVPVTTPTPTNSGPQDDDEH